MSNPQSQHVSTDSQRHKKQREFAWRRIVNRLLLFAIALIFILFFFNKPAAAAFSAVETNKITSVKLV